RKLLHNARGALSLLATNPFPDAPPRYIRARFYRYEFAPPGDPSGAWWKRTLLDEWLPPLSADDLRLRRFLAAHGWLAVAEPPAESGGRDRKSTRLNSSHVANSYAVFCLKQK